MLTRAGVAVAVVLTVAALGGAYLLRDPAPIGYWRTTSARDAYDRH